MNYLVIKEFDKIHKGLLVENNILNSEKVLKELIDFVKEYKDEETETSLEMFFSIGHNASIGDYIVSRNRVGVIELKSGLQIEILPKIDVADDNNSAKKKEIFLKMLRSLRLFSGKQFNMANLKASRMPLYEVFINMYVKEVFELAKKGLKSAYNSNTDNIKALKGKLLIKEQIRKNYIHKERFYCEYDEYELNRPENKLIKSALLKLLKVSNSDSNKKAIKQSLLYFEGVDESLNFDADFARVVKDRSVIEYETLLMWTKIFLKNNSFTTFAGSSKAKALLFQTDKLFEAYIAKQVKKAFANTEYKVSTQDVANYLFDSPRRFKLKPDIVIRNRNYVAILDTKWKDLINNPSKEYGISQADMYQMFAYSKKYKANDRNPNVWLLYPLNNAIKDIIIPEYKEENGVIVRICCLDLMNIDDSIIKLKESIEDDFGGE